jgi:hypothetical protein
MSADDPGAAPVGDSMVCGVPEQLATASTYAARHARVSTLRIEQLLLLQTDRAPTAARCRQLSNAK